MIAAPVVLASLLCSAYGQVELQSEIAIEALDEASGLAFSADGSRLWSHNDSGDEARLFTFDRNGKDQGQLVLIDQQAFDWEDMSAGPCGERRCLFVGDIGDNLKQREQITILRVDEPQAPGPGRVQTTQAQTLNLRYPDGPRDAESLAVDPKNGDLLLITKLRDRPVSEVFYLPSAAWDDPEQQRLTAIAEITWPGEGLATQATAATITPDGARLFVQTYSQALWFELTRHNGRISGLGAQSPAPHWGLGQCEAAAIAPDGSSLWFTCEGQPAPLATALCLDRPPVETPENNEPKGCGGCQHSTDLSLCCVFLIALRWRGRPKRVQESRSPS